MAPTPYPSNGTDWSAFSLSDLETRAANLAGSLSPQFRRALAAARRAYAPAVAAVRREGPRDGITRWGPIPGEDPAARLIWYGPATDLYWTSPGEEGIPVGVPVRHPAAAGTFATLGDASRAARRYIAIRLDDAARAAAGER
jgi:hypothetical protein